MSVSRYIFVFVVGVGFICMLVRYDCRKGTIRGEEQSEEERRE